MPESEREGAGKCWKCSLFLSVRKNWLFLWVTRPLGPSLTLLFFHIYSSTTLDFEALLFVTSSKHSSCFDLTGTPHGEWWECGSFARGLGASIVQTDWFSPYVNAWLTEFSIDRCFCGTSQRTIPIMALIVLFPGIPFLHNLNIQLTILKFSRIRFWPSI